jgi:protein-S-isoprenylcysteine O-methyltransferase Ste14
MKINIITLITGTILIILFSWFLSIKHKRYHGIARFFSFESMFILVLLNYPVWFKNPFSVMQLISWLLLLLSLYLAIAGFQQLKNSGKPLEGNFENTSVLVKDGLYRYIRHPLYLSLFLFGTGVMLKNPRYMQISLAVLNLAAVWLTAKIEEREMKVRFGDPYIQYMKETKMFVPYIL